MRTIFLILSMFSVLPLLCHESDYQACVTVNTSTGIYTIDPSGCVSTPEAEIDLTEYVK